MQSVAQQCAGGGAMFCVVLVFTTVVTVVLVLAIVNSTNRKEQFLVALASEQDIERARAAAAAAQRVLPQPGAAYQITLRQPAWASRLAAQASQMGIRLIACDTLTAWHEGKPLGWSVLASMREPARIFIVCRVLDTPVPVGVAAVGEAGSPWTKDASIRVWPSKGAYSPNGVYCTTTAEANACKQLLGVEPNMLQQNVAVLSIPGIWAMLLPLDSPALETLRRLHSANLLHLFDYSLAQQSHTHIEHRTEFVDSASILLGGGKAKREVPPAGMRLACAAFDYCIMCNVCSSTSASHMQLALDWLPDEAILDVGRLAQQGLPVCQDILNLATKRFSHRPSVKANTVPAQARGVLQVLRTTPGGQIEARLQDGLDARGVPALAGDSVMLNRETGSVRIVLDTDGVFRLAHTTSLDAVREGYTRTMQEYNGYSILLRVANVPRWHNYVWFADADVLPSVIERHADGSATIRMSLDAL